MHPIPSPCVRNCCLNSQDICLGCLRSLDEILLWGKASELQKAEIIKNVAARKRLAQQSHSNR
ncbi:DUF1289 domain-containing protein [Dasania sp. GY-MA-18]|uniref:DUF1289 domain-containing protein n=1 Tax=Dasania phycosphaerae TaxID=2950436 RepID=A0A9J6RI88_9GAMM|nr:MULTISPECIES: DUF1289 domain-containing protein [Dasania]MCR8921499.1 DUF1289 domain-containing protein [Dasania sp. GY-MA-18]MCZ0863927.1 DUF1289 domain-containing protein [Dasania phycosphaerae]MCZ0867655.1 DUF1289 domain-containing protein [Dasania phycosphaerae]